MTTSRRLFGTIASRTVAAGLFERCFRSDEHGAAGPTHSPVSGRSRTSRLVTDGGSPAPSESDLSTATDEGSEPTDSGPTPAMLDRRVDALERDLETLEETVGDLEREVANVGDSLDGIEDDLGQLVRLSQTAVQSSASSSAHDDRSSSTTARQSSSSPDRSDGEGGVERAVGDDHERSSDITDASPTDDVDRSGPTDDDDRSTSTDDAERTEEPQSDPEPQHRGPDRPSAAGHDDGVRSNETRRDTSDRGATSTETTGQDGTERSPSPADNERGVRERTEQPLAELRERVDDTGVQSTDDAGDDPLADPDDELVDIARESVPSDDEFEYRKVLLPEDRDDLPELAGTGLAQPYLDSIPSGYAIEAQVIEWLGWLVDESDAETAVEAVLYYEDIDWITADVRSDLLAYLDGIVDVEVVGDVEGRPEAFDLEDHLESLTYVYRLAAASEEVTADGI